nr:nucleotide exchange factor GrpE [Rhizobium sp. Q54]
MTDETKKNGPDAGQSEAASENPTATTASAQRDEPVNDAAEASSSEADPVAALQAENAELRDRFLRMAAEMENLRRRTARDVADARSYSVAAFARDMLGVSDNLRRAIDAVPAEMRQAADQTLSALLEGVEMTERSMLSALERHGVKKIDAEGQKFDPNYHQAMFEIPNAEVPNNTVLQVVQTGYTIGERVLRPAMVGVSKGGPKAESAAANAAEGEKADG